MTKNLRTLFGVKEEKMSRSKSNDKKRASTRAARRKFRNTYGDRSYEIVRRWARGQSSTTIADTMQVSVRTVATTIANANRKGNFSKAVAACNF